MPAAVAAARAASPAGKPQSPHARTGPAGPRLTAVCSRPPFQPFRSPHSSDLTAPSGRQRIHAGGRDRVLPRLRADRREAALLEQRLHLGIAAAEQAVGLGSIDRVAVRRGCTGAAASPRSCPRARRPRGTPSTCRRPSPPTTDSCSSPAEYASLANRWVNCGRRWRMAISRGMPMRASVSRSNASGSTTPSATVCRSMSTIARRQVLDRRVALVELLAAYDLVDERLRHRLLRLVVPREAVEHLARQQPVLVHLRRDTRRSRAASPARPGYAHVLQQAVQRVAELVEQRLRIVQRDQHGLARRALHEVVVVRRDRRDAAVERALRAVGDRPRARALARAREVVEVEQAAVRARRPCRSPPTRARRDGTPARGR